jgi:hypothetical protein
VRPSVGSNSLSSQGSDGRCASADSVIGLGGDGFISANDLMALANNALATSSSAHTDALADYLEVPEGALEAANNNTILVHERIPSGI